VRTCQPSVEFIRLVDFEQHLFAEAIIAIEQSSLSRALLFGHDDLGLNYVCDSSCAQHACVVVVCSRET
jgi:hypothetical protein